MEIWAGGGSSILGNPVRKGGGGVKNDCHPFGGVYFSWNSPL